MDYKRKLSSELCSMGEGALLMYAQDLQIEIERLQAENAELRRDAAIGAVVWKFIDRMNDVAPECGDSAERILSEFVAAVMPEFNSAMERWRL